MLLQKVHILAGLQCSVALIIFGVAGLTAFFDNRPQHTPAPPKVWEQAFEPPEQTHELALAYAAHEQLGLRVASYPEPWMMHRDSQGRLVVDFENPNASLRVTVLPGDRLRVEQGATSLLGFLTAMHEESPARRRRHDFPGLLLWSLYVEASILALLTLMGSGLWIWLRRRRLWSFGRAALAASTVLAVVLFLAVR